MGPLAVAVALVVCAPVAAPARAADDLRLDTFVELVRRHKPAVVNISTSETPVRDERPPESPREFFDRGPHDFRGPTPSMGSGFLISAGGEILTNNHVIEGATRILVRLSDDTEFEAKVIGRDPKTDLALLKIESDKNLPFVALGDSDRLEVGEWIAAIGNPFGLGQTVTVGIVSAKGRVIGSGPYDDYIQTDASINPGNSGGPLFNTRGEVVGIATAINPSGQGIGFAIPINLVKRLVTQLEQKGRVTRGWLGVLIQDLTKDLAKAFHLPRDEGALVSEVLPESPAAIAGIFQGDVIVEFDGRPVRKVRELPLMVAETPAGKNVKIRLIRDGREQSVSVKIAELDDTAEEKARASRPVPDR